MRGHRILAVIDWACTDLGEIPYDVTRPLDVSVKKLFKDHGRWSILLAFQQMDIV